MEFLFSSVCMSHGELSAFFFSAICQPVLPAWVAWLVGLIPEATCTGHCDTAVRDVSYDVIPGALYCVMWHSGTFETSREPSERPCAFIRSPEFAH